MSLSTLPLLTTALLLGGLGLGAHAAWVDASGQPLPDREHMRSAGALGVQLLLTPDAEAFRQAWVAGGGASSPGMQLTQSVRRGGSLSALLVLHGCKPDPDGKCDIRVAFTLVSPDGKRQPAGSGTLWNDAPFAGKQLLGNAKMTLGFSAQDARGRYRVLARVTDQVARIGMDLSTSFLVE